MPTAVFKELATVSSTSMKKAILAANENPTVLRVLKYALDPFRTYGLTSGSIKDPLQSANSATVRLHVDDGMAWTILDQLAARKMTGSLAINAVNDLIDCLSVPEAEVLVNIINKDLRIGAGATLVNQVWPKLIPEYDVMLAQPSEEYAMSDMVGRFAEPKYDGMRAIYSDGMFRSRNGLEIPSVQHLAPAAQAILDQLDQLSHLDGELITSTFNDSMSQLRKKDKPALDAKFMVFDALFPAEFNGDSRTTQRDRRGRLEQLSFGHSSIVMTPSIKVNSVEEIETFVKGIWEQGGEGAILKAPDGWYEPRRSPSWVKIKKFQTIDVPIVGTFPGKGKYKGKLGGFVVDVDGVPVNVGSGISDKDRDLLWLDRDLLPGKLIEVGFHEKTPDGSLRHPRFIRFRTDK